MMKQLSQMPILLLCELLATGLQFEHPILDFSGLVQDRLQCFARLLSILSGFHMGRHDRPQAHFAPMQCDELCFQFGDGLFGWLFHETNIGLYRRDRPIPETMSHDVHRLQRAHVFRRVTAE